MDYNEYVWKYVHVHTKLKEVTAPSLPPLIDAVSDGLPHRCAFGGRKLWTTFPTPTSEDASYYCSTFFCSTVSLMTDQLLRMQKIQGQLFREHPLLSREAAQRIAGFVMTGKASEAERREYVGWLFHSAYRYLIVNSLLEIERLDPASEFDRQVFIAVCDLQQTNTNFSTERFILGLRVAKTCYPKMNFRKDENIQDDWMRHAIQVFELASPDLRSNRQFVKAAVEKNRLLLGNGCCLEHALSDLRKDRKIVKVAVEEIGGALGYALGDLKEDKELVFLALRELQDRATKRNWEDYVWKGEALSKIVGDGLRERIKKRGGITEWLRLPEADR